jgi:hypothetical protein
MAPPAARLEPVIETPPGDPGCPLEWPEPLPPVVILGTAPDEECDEVTPGPADVRATMRGHRAASAHIEGPDGSGHFVSITLAVGGRQTCFGGSTVGWRALGDAAASLAPLPWLADVDGDGDAELVVWSRLPFGDSEYTNGLLPIVYVLDGARLVRRDDRARALRRRVAAAYQQLASRDVCMHSLALALGV